MGQFEIGLLPIGCPAVMVGVVVALSNSVSVSKPLGNRLADECFYRTCVGISPVGNSDNSLNFVRYFCIY